MVQMIETLNPTEYFPIWKAIAWCFYPLAILCFLELMNNFINDDDDDQDGGMMIPAYQASR